MKGKRGQESSKRSRSLRSRPVPSMLSKNDVDTMAKRRVMMVLHVLSGRVPVTQAIEDAKISRGTYYQLETRALQAMLRALAPSSTSDDETSTDGATLVELKARVDKLEVERRRLERLLAMTTKVLGKGPMATARGRPRRSSRTAAKSKSTTRNRIDKAAKSAEASTPKPAGGDGS